MTIKKQNVYNVKGKFVNFYKFIFLSYISLYPDDNEIVIIILYSKYLKNELFIS